VLRTWLVGALALSGMVASGCAGDKKAPEQNPFVGDMNPATATNGEQNGGSSGMQASTNGASTTGGEGDGRNGGTNGASSGNTSSEVDANAGSGNTEGDGGDVPALPDAGPPDANVPEPDPGIDPDHPPKATAACGTDLNVDNGRVIPDFGDVPAASAFVGDPLADGTLLVVSADKTLDNPDPTRSTYNTTAYGPSTDGKVVDAGPFPLVVLVPGFSGNHTGYGHFTNHFVSHGVAVLGVTAANVAFTDTPNNPANVTEILNALAWALTDSPLAGKIDMDKLAIAGHSQGGKLAFFTAAKDPRFKLVIAWDPQNGGGAPCFIAGVVGQDCNAWPVAPNCDPDRSFENSGMLATLRAESIVFAARDTNVTPDAHLWAEHFYRGAPSPASLVLFPSAGHGDWAAAGATTDITKRVQMALVLSRFFGKTGLEAYSPKGSYLSGESSVTIHTSK